MVNEGSGKTASTPKSDITLQKLRDTLTPQQRKLINSFWKHFLDSGRWPSLFEVHQKYEKAKTEDFLRTIGGNPKFAGNIVQEVYDQNEMVYQLSLAGIMLTHNGKKYEKWFIHLVDFLRKKFYQKKKDSDNYTYDAVSICGILKLEENQRFEFGQLLRFASPYQSYGHTNGNWQITMPKSDIQEISKKEPVDERCQKLILKYFNYQNWVYKNDQNNQMLPPSEATISSTKQLEALLNSQIYGIQKITNEAGPKIFISHSSQDRALAEALTDLLKSAFRMSATEILCTSVDGHKLKGGVDTENELMAVIPNAEVLIGLLTPDSLSSSYVLFELGARWILKKPLIPIIASGATMSDIKDPLKAKNALDATNQADVFHLIENIAEHLKQQTEPTSAYNSKAYKLVQAAKHKKSPFLLANGKKVSSKDNIEKTKLDWPRLVRRMTLVIKLPGGGAKKFYDLIAKTNLNPFEESNPYKTSHSVTCAGLHLTETTIEGFWSLLEKSPLDAERKDSEYSFEISPDMLEKTSTFIQKWYDQFQTYKSMWVQIDFTREVQMDDEPHRITSKIFGTNLKMAAKEVFEFDEYSFELKGTTHSGPTFEMYIEKKLETVPWSEIFATLVRTEVFILNKLTAKNIWI